MSRYVVIMERGEYSVGEGAVEYFDADSPEEAFAKFAEDQGWDEYLEHPEDFGKNYLRGECEPDSVTVLEIAGTDEGKIYTNFMASIDKAVAEYLADEEEQKERAEFERLSKKFG